MNPYVIIVILVSLAITMAIPPDHPHSAEWEEFKKKHGKKYKDDKEEEARFKIWSGNKDKLDAHNKRYQEGAETYEVAMHKFGDLTAEEFSKTHKGLDAKRLPSRISHTKRDADPSRNVTVRGLPTSVDWRTLGKYVSPVKDQYPCSSCWAFSATGAMEGLVGKLSQSTLQTPASLSEQQLLDCVYNGDTCALGGWFDDAWMYIQQVGGAYSEQNYPYQGQYGSCQNLVSAFNATNLIGGYTLLPISEAALQQAVATVGPVSVAIDSSDELFSYYTGPGVYYNPACSEYYLDHAVLIVGYGTDRKGNDYWIVKNSWGTDLGIQGYWKMARNRNNNCGIATYAAYPLG